MDDLLLDPENIRGEYASEERLLARASIYKGSDGVDPNDLVVEFVTGSQPQAVLEVGSGPGILAERLLRRGLSITTLDSSERMVELTRCRGVDARLGDIQELPFGDGRFDAVIAAWMLYHVPNLERALREVSRVLRPGGRFIAVTNSGRHLSELWDFIGLDGYELAFNAENGAKILAQHFDHVERRDVEGTVTFRDTETVRCYVSSTTKARHLADDVPTLIQPLRVTRRNVVFIATGPSSRG